MFVSELSVIKLLVDLVAVQCLAVWNYWSPSKNKACDYQS